MGEVEWGSFEVQVYNYLGILLVLLDLDWLELLRLTKETKNKMSVMSDEKAMPQASPQPYRRDRKFLKLHWRRRTMRGTRATKGLLILLRLFHSLTQ